jgi:hypothetical protein
MNQRAAKAQMDSAEGAKKAAAFRQTTGTPQEKK